MEIEHGKTERGFTIMEFKDHGGLASSLQDSSLATDDAVWLGRGSDRMHLNRAGVNAILPYLDLYLEETDFPLARFTDLYGDECEAYTQDDILNIGTLGGIMTLDREQVRTLRPLLTHFTETGFLPQPAPADGA